MIGLSGRPFNLMEIIKSFSSQFMSLTGSHFERRLILIKCCDDASILKLTYSKHYRINEDMDFKAFASEGF